MTTPTKAGDVLASHDDVFAEWFEEDITVRNYLGADASGVTRDDYGDVNAEDRKVLHPDSPVETTGQVDETDSSTTSETYGIEETVDVEIRLDPGVRVHNGGVTDSQDREMPYPTEIEDANGNVFVVVAARDQGNGAQLALAQA